MKEENFGKFIKDIRKKNNLTQKDLADKYNVTYQAVSKWENGINMPDISLIKKIAKDYNVSIEDMMEGKLNIKKKYNKILILIISLIALLLVVVFLIFNDNDFKFKTIKSNCDNFKITGSLAYNNNKTSIYISNINYCGKKDDEIYINIKCKLYEKVGDITKEISIYNYSEKENITLDDFLNDFELNVDNYSKACKDYSENSLILEINGTTNDGKNILYQIPLTLESNCSK